jgi:hypothetical protein
VFGQKCLIRGHHVFARFQQLKRYAASRFQSTNQHRHDLDLWISQNFIQIVSDRPLRQFTQPLFSQITDNRSFQPQLLSHVAREPLSMVHQQSGNAAANRTQPNDGYFYSFHKMDFRLESLRGQLF